jgi:Glycosyltransferase family 87
MPLLNPTRVQAWAFMIAAIYTWFLITVFRNHVWILDHAGKPIYTDFTEGWVVGIHLARGHLAPIYSAGELIRIQTAILGPDDSFYPNFPYPPTFCLLLVPLGLLPYARAFLTWDILTLLAFAVVVWKIVPRVPAIALLLASPFTAWNMLAGQNGFLTAALLGAALVCLERRPVLAGFFLGCLTYKPQYGMMIPVALIAARQWRAVFSAAGFFLLLIGISGLAFGFDAWWAFPQGLANQYGVVLDAEGHPDASSDWGRLQTVYGLVRLLSGGATLAWIAQALTIGCVAVVVWRVWRSGARHDLKAAVLTAACLMATPYAFSYDMAMLALPFAFLVRDQMRHGLLRGEQPAQAALFLICLAALIWFGDQPGHTTFGSVPLGPFVLLTLLGLTLRRVRTS